MPAEEPARQSFSVAVLLPCRNDAPTVGAAVRGFAAALPGAAVYVFDNGSTDDTALEATRAGARVFRDNGRGKRSVVRRMFADVEADVYVMAAADGSCDTADAPSLVNALITEHVDMVVGMRPRAPGGRALSARLQRALVGGGCADVESAYRAFTRRFVKSFPAISAGFAVETDMSIHASQLMIPTAEIELSAGARDAAPRQKLTFGAALRRAAAVAGLAKETRPFLFYALAAMALWIAGLALISPPLFAWAATGAAHNSAAALIGIGLLAIGFIVAGSGLVLDGIARSRAEQKRILFLTVPRLGLQQAST